MKNRTSLEIWRLLARRCAWTGLMISGFAILGCPAGTVPGDTSNYVDGNADPAAQSPLGKTSGEPNDDFGDAVVGVPEASGLIRLKGTVSSGDDLDVFLLGSLSSGDRVLVDASAVASLDVSIAIFDGEGRLVSDNDDRSDQNLDSHIDFVARHADDGYFLVVTRSAFADPNRRTGSYTAQVQFQRGGETPLPQQQMLFLKFDGGRVDSPVLGHLDLASFDAGAIDRAYTGKTQEIKQTIVDIMRQNYERFNVVIESSDDFTPGTDCDFSTVFFGGFNDQAFGIAENVDLYDSDFCDDAIIFTESFTPSLFSSVPTAEEMGVAIGNVAAHEAGHLLGLNHVDDDLDLMDDRSAADAFLFDQEFMESILSTDIMPIGTQDGVLLLDEIVGPAVEDSSRLIPHNKHATQNKTGILGGKEIIRRRSH